MRITRSRTLTVSMGAYETYKFGAEVSVTHHDLGFTDDGLVEAQQTLADDKEAFDVTDALQKYADTQLDLALVQELEDAADLTADKKSFLLRAMRGGSK